LDFLGSLVLGTPPGGVCVCPSFSCVYVCVRGSLLTLDIHYIYNHPLGWWQVWVRGAACMLSCMAALLPP